MTNFNTFNCAADAALSAYLGRDEYTKDQVELVSDLLAQAAESLSKDEYANAERYLEKASSYVQADMSELELDTWVDLCVDALTDYAGI